MHEKIYQTAVSSLTRFQVRIPYIEKLHKNFLKGVAVGNLALGLSRRVVGCGFKTILVVLQTALTHLLHETALGFLNEILKKVQNG